MFSYFKNTNINNDIYATPAINTNLSVLLGDVVVYMFALQKSTTKNSL